MAQKIKYWLLISLILSIGFGQILRFDLYGIPIFVHDFLVALFLIVELLTIKDFKAIEKGKKEYKILYLGIKLFLVGLALGYIRAISLYPMTSLVIPLMYTIRVLAYLALFSFLKISKIKIPRSIIFLTGIITLLAGYAQYLFLPDMRIFQFLGWDDHLSRMTMPHFDPTFTAFMISLFALSIIKSKSLFKVPYFGFSVVAILLTYARSVWLSLVILGFIFIKNKLVLYTLIFSIILGVFLLPKRFGEGTNLLRTYSISSRVNSDNQYIFKYKWELLVGRGMNTLILDRDDSGRPNHSTGPNNSYLYLLATTGIFGLVGWSLLLFGLYKYSHNKEVIIFIIVASFFNNVMFYPFALIWMLILETMVPSEA